MSIKKRLISNLKETWIFKVIKFILKKTGLSISPLGNPDFNNQINKSRRLK